MHTDLRAPMTHSIDDVDRRLSTQIVDVENYQLDDIPASLSDNEEKGDDEDEEDVEGMELQHAARAGIRLLEENAQLLEELLQWQQQCAQFESEKAELQRQVVEKDKLMTQMMERLRESIRETQNALSELSKVKEQADELRKQVQHQAQTQASGHLYGIQQDKHLNSSLDSSISSNMATVDEPHEPPSLREPSPVPSDDRPKEQKSVVALRRYSMPSVLDVASDLELKFEKTLQLNSALGRQLSSAQKQLRELKPLQSQLVEAELELELLRGKVKEQARELACSVDEREEERQLIESLRHTIEIYQNLGRAGHQASSLKLLNGISRKPSQSNNKCFMMPVSATKQEIETVASATCPAGYDTSTSYHKHFLEHEISVLQDLVGRFRTHWKPEVATRRATKREKVDLLQQMEKIQHLLQRQCHLYEKKHEDLVLQGDDDVSSDSSKTVYEILRDHAVQCQTKQEQREAEQNCFSMLHRLFNSWTTDKAKRMRLYDWLTNAIRGTGKRCPLYLNELSEDLASGFRMLLVPILREKFGVQVQLEKRLRNVTVTDLRMEVAEKNASAKSKACSNRSLPWLIDFESSLFQDEDWVGEFVRRKKAINLCANT